ncbi:B12-binding domain-containing radical SAM protein [Methanocrinis sp.]|uniref:B12-binding domain-containing radical SAM protein n=1 Tax=Methanocrinis sp. TaxID=3101522 RepID=UPI003D10D884
MKSYEPEEANRIGLEQKSASPRVLFTTVYRNETKPYDYIGANSRSRWFRFRWPRNQSFGLRFLKQNIPEIEIAEFPTFEDYRRRLAEGWDVVGLSFYLSETEEALEMADLARASGKVGEVWAGNYGALTPEIKEKFDRVFVGYAESQVAPYFGRTAERIVHPPLIEHLDTTFGLKLNIYGALFTIRGCSVGCKFCQAPCFCNRPSPLPLESIDRVLSYYQEQGIKVVVIEDESFGANRRHADRVVDLLDEHEMVWGCMARADYLRDKIDEWAEMRRTPKRRSCGWRNPVSGFAGAAIGIENFHQEVLDDVTKRERAEEILETVERLQHHGLGTVGYYMIGFAGDTKGSMKEDIERLAALKLDLTQICVLTPLPKTELWEEIDRRYGIFDRDYHHYDGKHLVWNHPSITPSEMERVLDRSMRRVNPRTAPLRSSARIWKKAYQEAGLAGIRELLSYIFRANRFDYDRGPRMLKADGD